LPVWIDVPRPVAAGATCSAAGCVESETLMLQRRHLVSHQVSQMSGQAPGEELPAWAEGSKLVVVNGCPEEPMWIASEVPAGMRGIFPDSWRLGPGESFTYVFPANMTVASTRFWPKMGCTDQGSHCEIGSSAGAWQHECPEGGCAPPVDSKFEATFWDASMGAPVDWWDTSGVDGYTLPYKLELDSKCPRGVPLDCSEMRFADCPTSERLSGETRDLRVYRDSKVVGCYSTCGKLTYANLGNSPTFSPSSPEALSYCCPTPPVSPQDCKAGPVEDSDYVKLFRTKCRHVYSYAYDDATGLQVCPAGTTYTWTLFCPA